MKITAASLLLAFAGFLQESKCMFNDPAQWTFLKNVHIELTLENGDKLEGDLEMTRQKPSWLETEPLENFQTYDVFFHTTMLCNYKVQLPYRPQESGSHVPKSVKIRIGNHLKYLSYEGFKDSKHAEEIRFLNRFNHVYVTMPGTKKIYFELLESEGAFNRMTIERQEREEREMREKRDENPAGETSKTRA